MSEAMPHLTWQRRLNRLGLRLMRALACLPLPVLRALGWVFGQLLHTLAVPRRRVALTNWALCFPHLSQVERRRAVRQHFVLFAQAWLDRAWLWEAPPDVVRRRLHLVGEVDALRQLPSAVLFAPHFVGMDAGWTALTLLMERRFCGIYARQANVEVDHWMAQGRQRFGQPHIVVNRGGVKAMVAALRAGEPLYLLPDMDHGVQDSVFAPFFGVTAATLMALPRFARLGRAPVVPITSRLTPQGYEVRVWPAWHDYPTDDLQQDVEHMNLRLQAMIETMPQQYYWVHKRFKTRPAGEASVYRRRP